jgi:hypothetical protein
LHLLIRIGQFVKSSVRVANVREVCYSSINNNERDKMYKEGDTITYIPFGGGYRTGIVTEKFDDIKNGLPGFDLELEVGGQVWGYDSQIIKVLPAK